MTDTKNTHKPGPNNLEGVEGGEGPGELSRSLGEGLCLGRFLVCLVAKASGDGRIIAQVFESGSDA